MAALIWATWNKIEPETRFFCHFPKDGSLVFLEIAYNDSLQQCLTCSRGENPNWTKQAKFESKIRFFAIFFQVLLIRFPLNCIEW